MIHPAHAAAAYHRAADAARTGGSPPQDRLSLAAAQFERLMTEADRSSISAMAGQADTTALVQSLTEAEFALDAAVAIRDKVVEAYQDILRMPV
ncbi:flagellar hook-basal body complex protein FliE [Paracoccus isoporae]|uniref:Flagellar hook-basal body complex protein FliE n=1 Tax=Paracoccus isoporae TaxID=591205 RepID=A0A1G7CWI7_9RHOB|nr:flagellar hook-basal body complex protein FliE [Paracoccus isoporae]SDE43669.1 flagellar hook-basal body complex protein FliE [Paracoccus isoporae]